MSLGFIRRLDDARSIVRELLSFSLSANFTDLTDTYSQTSKGFECCLTHQVMDKLPLVLFIFAVAATIFMSVYPGRQNSSRIRVLDD